MKNFLSALSLTALLISSCTAQAQTADFVELTPAQYLQKDLTTSIGLGIQSQPKYADGSQRTIVPLPLLDMQWKSGIFFSTVSGFGINFASNPSWQYGLRLGMIPYQEQSATNHASGPGNTSSNISPGAFANYLINDRFSILTALSAGAGTNNHYDGALISVGGRYIRQINDEHRVFAILAGTWANTHYMQDYYGVTPQQAIDYSFPVFTAKSGMLRTKLSLGWNWDIDKHWSIVTGSSLTRPMGDAGHSPIASDKTQVVVYSVGYYRF